MALPDVLELIERMVVIETRMLIYDKEYESMRAELKEAFEKSSQSRLHIFEKIEKLDKRINSLVIGGLVGVLGVLLNVVISLVALFFKYKFKAL